MKWVARTVAATGEAGSRQVESWSLVVNLEKRPDPCQLVKINDFVSDSLHDLKEAERGP